MREFLERMRLTGTPTEEVREWSGMTHRVAELTGPFPTPDEMRVELWLHEESATRLLDMCDRIDAEFDRTKTENVKLREQVTQLQSDWESERDYADQMEAKEKMAVAENAKLREYAESYAKAVEGEGCGWCPYDTDLVCDAETMPMRDGCKLYDELRELGIEVDA